MTNNIALVTLTLRLFVINHSTIFSFCKLRQFTILLSFVSILKSPAWSNFSLINKINMGSPKFHPDVTPEKKDWNLFRLEGVQYLPEPINRDLVK